MENSFLPQDLFNIILTYCDDKRLGNFRATCQAANKKITFKLIDPVDLINYSYEKKGYIIYNGKRLNKKLVLKNKDKDKKAKLNKIVEAYRHIVDEYSLEKDQDTYFSILWGPTYYKYKCNTVNGFANVNVTYVDKNKTVQWPLQKGNHGYDDHIRRNFQLYNKHRIYGGKWSGTYVGETPRQAAKKAFTALIKYKKEKGEDIEQEINFIIKEKTRTSSAKYYYYTGQRVKFDQPHIVNIGGHHAHGKQIQFNYINKIHKRKHHYTIELKP